MSFSACPRRRVAFPGQQPQRPQVAHEPDEHVAHDAPPPRPLRASPPAAANVENFLCTFRLSQCGQTGGRRAVIERNSFSNSLPQASQANSYIGMAKPFAR